MADFEAPTDEIGYANPYGLREDDKGWSLAVGWRPEDETQVVPELRWPTSVKTYKRMVRDDSRVSSMIDAITLPIRRAQWWIDPNGAQPEVVQHVAQCLDLPIRGDDAGRPASTEGRARDRFSWNRHLVDALACMRYGHAYFEQVYRTDDATGLVSLRKLAARPQTTISDVLVARDGGLVGIRQHSPAGDILSIRDVGDLTGITTRTIPVDRLVAYLRNPEPGDWLGESVLTPAYKYWLLKDELIRIEAATARRNGMGIPVYYGSDIGEPEELGGDLAKGEKMARALRAGMGAGAAVPAGADLKLLGVQGNLPDLRAAIEGHDRAIAIAGLAHFLNLDRGGSYALASVQADTFVQAVQAAAEAIRDTANMHVIEDLVDVNWGLDEQAPKLGFDEIGSRKDAVASAIQQLVAAGVLLPDRSLEEAVRQSYGLPAKDWISTEDLAKKRADAAAAEVAAFAEVGLAPPVDGKAAGAGVVAPPTPPVEPGTTDETGKPAFAKAGDR